MIQILVLTFVTYLITKLLFWIFRQRIAPQKFAALIIIAIFPIVPIIATIYQFKHGDSKTAIKLSLIYGFLYLITGLILIVSYI